MKKFRNGRIRTDLEVKKFVDVVEEGKLRWYGHVLRMGRRGCEGVICGGSHREGDPLVGRIAKDGSMG